MLIERRCAFCREPFKTHATRGTRKTCSDRCAREQRRKAISAAPRRHRVTNLRSELR